MNKYSAAQWSPGAPQLSTRGPQSPHALIGGSSVQVQFPHLKISTLTTVHTTTQAYPKYWYFIGIHQNLLQLRQNIV